ncbi:MAG: hypothetical protein V3W51_01010 [Candidatus Brocadiales bacterium]
MNIHIVRVRLTVFFLFLVMFPVTETARADMCTGWRDFSLTGQLGIYGGTFAVEGLKFFRTGDVEAELKIKNIGREEARAAISIALFDSKRFLLTAVSFSPPLLQPNDADRVSMEFFGSAEVLSEIKYYQLSVIERGEK